MATRRHARSTTCIRDEDECLKGLPRSPFHHGKTHPTLFPINFPETRGCRSKGLKLSHLEQMICMIDLYDLLLRRDLDLSRQMDS